MALQGGRTILDIVTVQKESGLAFARIKKKDAGLGTNKEGSVWESSSRSRVRM